MLYACDPRWWDVHLDRVRESFRGELVTQWASDKEREAATARGLTAIQGRHRPGLGRDMLHYNSNSGAQAINLAYLRGATRIVLVGYDMGWTGGKAHWFGDHPQGLTNGRYEAYVQNFDRLAQDLRAERVEVINCSRQTNLHQFQRSTLESVYGE